MSTQETKKDVRPEVNVVKSDSATTVALTAYQGGPAVIRELRKLALPVGKSRVYIGGLPKQFVPNSQTITGVTGEGKFKAGQRSLRPANLTHAAILAQSIGKTIVLIEESKDGSERKIEGVLEHIVDGRLAVIKPSDTTAGAGVLVVPITTKVMLRDGIPAGLSNLSVLVMAPEVEKAGEFGVKLLYEAGGISWTPWYEVFYNVKTGKLERFACNIDITNESGADLKDANLKLLSGHNHSDAAYRAQRRGGARMMAMAAAAPALESAGGGGFEADVDFGGAEVEDVGESKMYKITDPVTLENGVPNTQTLVHAADVPVEHEYHAHAGHFVHLDDGNASDLPKLPVNVKLRLKNTAASNLGAALPPGEVRIFEPDSSGDLQKTDSSRVTAHISSGEEFTLDLRNPARDIKVTREQIEYKQDPAEDEPEVVVTPEGGLPQDDMATEALHEGPRMTMAMAMPTVAAHTADEADVEDEGDGDGKKKEKPRYAEEEREVTILNYKDKEVTVTVHEAVPHNAVFLSKSQEFAKFHAGSGRGTFKVTVPAKSAEICGSTKIRYRIKWRIN